MTAAVLEATFEQATGRALPALRILVLARAACEEGITRAELARDLAFAIASGSARNALDAELAALVRNGLVVENRARFRAGELGLAILSAELGAKLPLKSWAEMRDQRLVAKALGLDGVSAARLKALAKPEPLRAEILGRYFGFRVPGAASPARLRSELALVALERAFGNAMMRAASARSGLGAKASRLLAGQLLAKPRDVGTDSRLVALLAAAAVGAAKTDADALRSGLLRRYASGAATTPAVAADVAVAKLLPALTVVPATVPSGARPPAASRPGLEGFAAAIGAAAATVAEGWPGNRKALVSRVWQAVAAGHADWGLSEIEFKAMLAEAHRTGHLALVTADLKDKRLLPELQASAISYKNTVWHLVRVQD